MLARVLAACTLALSLVAACTRPPRPAPPADTTELRYLALGDSFTAGTGSGPEAAFPARLAARWQAAGRRVTLKNLGVSGYTTQDLIDVELPAVRPFAPTLVTLAIGANDIAQGRDLPTYRAQLRRIFAGLRQAGVGPARVLVLPQPDWSHAPAAALFAEPARITRKIADFNQALSEEARAAGARYLDLFPLMARQARAGRFAGDGLHPSAECHDEWAAAILAAQQGAGAP